MTEHVAYYRVSTDRQGASGLGLDAQRAAVARHLGSAARVLSEFGVDPTFVSPAAIWGVS